MRQLTLALDPPPPGELKERIKELQRALNYNPYQTANSQKKHLGVATLNECNNPHTLHAYAAYLEDKDNEED